MKKTLVIFKKELMDTLRDRRTIIMMVVIPLLVFPLIMSIMVKLTASQQKKAEQKILQVGLITHGNARDFRETLFSRSDMVVDEEVKPAEIKELVTENKKDFIIIFSEDFDARVAAKEMGVVHLYYKSSSEINIAKKRVNRLLEDYKKGLLKARLQGEGLDSSFLLAMTVDQTDLASTKEKLGESIGGFLPYFFILFCFLGAMYPAIDLAAGEKERATLETLLASPASRLQIVLGKFLVVTLAGIGSSAISMLGLFIGVKQIKEIPKELLDKILQIIEPQSIALLLSLLVPLCVFFAAALLSISIFARSFKEAQSTMTPLNFMVIIPAAVGLLPGIKLDAVFALIPVLNVSLATREIIAGTIKTGLLIEVYLSLFILAGLSLYFCTRWFNRESVIFR